MSLLNRPYLTNLGYRNINVKSIALDSRYNKNGCLDWPLIDHKTRSPHVEVKPSEFSCPLCAHELADAANSPIRNIEITKLFLNTESPSGNISAY